MSFESTCEVIKTNIIIENMTFQYPSALVPLFKNISLSIGVHWKLGVVGRNGRGKSTLLKLISGALVPQYGYISSPNNISTFPVEIVDQNQSTFNTVKELIGPFKAMEKEMEFLLKNPTNENMQRYGEVIEVYEMYNGYTIDTMIEKEFRQLNLSVDLLDQPFTTLSGGEKTKAQIAGLFLKPTDYLLIDEPTNHLDLKGRNDLANYLKSKKGYFIISHDQIFLDACCDHILEINKTGLHLEKGDCSSWSKNKSDQENFELLQKETLQKETAQLEKAVMQSKGYSFAKEKQKIGSFDKGFVGARAARLMKRAKNLEKQQERKLEESKTLLKTYEKIRHLEFKQIPLSSNNYIHLENISYAIEEHTILSHVNIQVNKGDRIWLKGHNGSGKSTLLNIISNTIKPDSGYIKRAIDLEMAYAYQDIPVKTGTVAAYLEMYQTNLTGFIRMLDYFDMDMDYIDRHIETLSEGERKKIDLARAFSSNAPLYIWDEPLNYMDFHFRVQLEKAVKQYKPTIIFVEHDIMFGQEIATKTIDLDK